MVEDIYICLQCSFEHDGYNDLKHDDYDSGGFCRCCGSDRIVHQDELEGMDE